MRWEPLEHSEGVSAHGERTRTYYVIVRAVGAGYATAGVRLTRWPEETPYHDPYEQGAAAARNLIEFPLGRGPGRPAGEPEIEALFGMAKDYAEKYEVGGDLEGYPYWQRAQDVDPGALSRAVERLAPRTETRFYLGPQEHIRFIEDIVFEPYAHEFRPELSRKFTQLGPNRTVRGLAGKPEPRPRATDWQWADGSPLPEDRWPPAEYFGPLLACDTPGVHDAHWFAPPAVWLEAYPQVWCPGRLAVVGGAADGCTHC